MVAHLFRAGTEACPYTMEAKEMSEQNLIVERQVNEKVARMNAFIAVIAALLFIFTPAKWVIIVMGIDFFLRGFIKPKYSPIGRVNGAILNMAKVKPSMVYAPPKIFAAKIGFFCCVVMGVSYYLFNFMPLANVVGGMLAFFAFLESFLGYCVGCKIYAIIHSPKFSRKNL